MRSLRRLARGKRPAGAPPVLGVAFMSHHIPRAATTLRLGVHQDALVRCPPLSTVRLQRRGASSSNNTDPAPRWERVTKETETLLTSSATEEDKKYTAVSEALKGVLVVFEEDFASDLSLSTVEEKYTAAATVVTLAAKAVPTSSALVVAGDALHGRDILIVVFELLRMAINVLAAGAAAEGDVSQSGAIERLGDARRVVEGLLTAVTNYDAPVEEPLQKVSPVIAEMVDILIPTFVTEMNLGAHELDVLRTISESFQRPPTTEDDVEDAKKKKAANLDEIKFVRNWMNDAESEKCRADYHPVNPPKGFNKFYRRAFRLHMQNTEEGARAFSDSEAVTAQEGRKEQWRFNMFRAAVGLGFAIGVSMGISHFVFGYFDSVLAGSSVTWQDITALDAEGKLKSVHVVAESHKARFYGDDGLSVDYFFVDFNMFMEKLRMLQHNVAVTMNVPSYIPVTALLLLTLIPILIWFDSSLATARTSQMFGKKSKKTFKFMKEGQIKTRMPDVAGLTEAKHEVMEVVDFLKKPDKYTALGAKLPKGVLLDGPPGVGKTLLAKAVAGEAGVPFISCSGSEFEEIYVGVGASRVRELFQMAREAKPCVVFIDEIDAFGRKRSSENRAGGLESRNTVNAFLSEMDGFNDSSGVVLLAGTNRADVLDNALTRPGRFDRKISIDKPPHKDRAAIAEVHLKPLKLDPSLSIPNVAETLAGLTPGCTGADISNICNEAAIVAVREELEFVTLHCFHKAIERVLVGIERRAKKLLDRELKRIAFHEAGHAVVSWFLKHVDPVIKVTIVPRGGSKVGVTQYLPKEVFIQTQEAIREKMVARLAGYAVERRLFRDISTDAADDLHRVTDMAFGEVATFGMAPDVVGHFNFPRPSGESATVQKPYGEVKAEAIDQCVDAVMAAVTKQAEDLVEQYLTEIKIVAGTLLREETIKAQELWRLLGERPTMTTEHRTYLES